MSRYNIAIIGMGCVFPSANSVEQYWKNIKSGDTFFSKMPDRIWRIDNYLDDDRSVNNKTYNSVGAFIQDFEFPFLEYKLPPNAMKGVDPAQLVTLEATREALADAGIEPRSPALSEAVTIIGMSGVDAFAHCSIYLKRLDFMDRLRPQLLARGVPEELVEEVGDQLRDGLIERNHIFNPTIASIGAIPSSISNRVAQVFGIRGFNMTVDGACASSFAALDTACHALMAGDARVAIAGGTDLGTNPAIYVGFSRVDGLSLSGQSNPFDHTADGLIIGEGTGVVVLKRLEDALADGDNIKGVVRGLGGSSDGAGQAIYAPSIPGRVDALQAGLESAETPAEDVQYIEAHATSTVVGDANEYDAIANVYANPRAEGLEPIRLGSVKHQIGHLKAAAGVAGLIKTVLCMEHGEYPHMPRFRKLTPGAEKETDALLVPQEMAPWTPHADGRRCAAVTANGFGGVNYHVVVERADEYHSEPRPPVDRAVAVVGMECRVAGADNVDTFWENVTAGKNTFSDVDAEKLGWQYHLDAGPENERITTRVVSTLDDYKFNALKFKIFPTAISQISPTQLLGVEIGDRLLASVGFDLAEPKNIGVSIGSMHDDYFPVIWSPIVVDEWIDTIRNSAAYKKADNAAIEGALAEARSIVISDSPPVTEHTLPGWMTNVTAGRMANKLNLHGPNITVDTACSSGIAALIPAIYQLMYGRVDMMISGGLNRQLSDAFTCGVCGLGAVAEEVPRPFDAQGAGFLIGEGGVFYLLKRLADAKRDGDKIYAVIDAVSGSSEADSKSMIAPSEEAMTRSIRGALALGTTRPEEIGVVDTHGSANPISDMVEARALATELRGSGNAEPLQITAIKSHIGHIYGGSGASSMLSVIQTMRTKQVPGIRNLETVRAEIAELDAKVQPRKGTAPYSPSFTAGGINSIGLGGANYFAVLRSPDADEPGTPSGTSVAAPPRRPRRRRKVVRAGDQVAHDVFVCLAENKKDFGAALGRALGQNPIPEVVTEGSSPKAKLAVTFNNQRTLRTKLESTLRMIGGGHDVAPLESRGVFTAAAEPGDPPRKLAFSFPGQGVQYIGMGRPLYESDPIFKGVIDHVHDLSMKHFSFDLLGHIYGDETDPELKKDLGTLVGAQTSVFAIEVAVAEVLQSMGVTPDVLIGQSFGEIAALTVAGVWDFETAFNVVKARIDAAEQITNSGGPQLGMMSLVCSDEQRDAILGLVGDTVVLTNINAPNRFILSGELAAIAKTVAVAESFGGEARQLAIGGAFHSYFMEPAREGYRKALLELPCSTPTIPILSTITGDYLAPDKWTSEYVADLLSGQLVTKVNLVREFRRLHADGVRAFLEVGPGWSLTKMTASILDGLPHRRSPTLHPKVGDAELFRRARAFLMALGHLESAAERQNLPGMFSPDFMEYMEDYEPSVISLLEEVRERFLEHLRLTSDMAPEQVSPPAPTPALTPPAAAEPAAAPEAAAAVEPAPSSAPAAPAAPATGGAGRAPTDREISTWIERVQERLVDVTGYPREMLEVDLDLEADLGVDSVQRAEIWVSLTAAHNLDSEARPQGVRTISNLATTLAELAAADTEAPFEAPQGPAAAGDEAIAIWVGRLRGKLVDVTGYPEEMLEEDLDLEADLGVDSVQRAEIWVSLTAAHGIDSEARPQGVRTIRNLATSLAELSGELPAGAAAPAQPAAPAAQQAAPAQQPAPVAQPAAPTPATPAQPPAEARSKPPAPAAPSAAAEMAVWVERVREKLVDVTGYPAEMLEAELDLEADLGVDSVQRAEIWVTLTTAHELDGEARPQGVRTITHLAAALHELAADAGDQESAPEGTDHPKALEPDSVDAEDEDRCELFLGGFRPVSKASLQSFNCRKLLIVAAGEGKAADELSTRLSARGIHVKTTTPDELSAMETTELEELLQGSDTLLYLAHEGISDLLPDGEVLRHALDLGWRQLFHTFQALTPALGKMPVRIIVPVTQDGAFGAAPSGRRRLLGAFPAGFVRSMSRELPACTFQLVDTGKTPWVEAVERHINRRSKHLEIGLRSGSRVRPTFQRLSPSNEYRNTLHKNDLVLVTGGARGIVFECVVALAQRTGCQVLLTGRTELPAGKRPDWMDATSENIANVIRDFEIGLVRGEGMSLREAKRAGAKARAQWEVQRNLTRLEATGIGARYEVCDVTDPKTFRSLIKRTSRENVIRGVVHGAGVQRARLITELEESTVERTINTKMGPLLTMLDVLDWSQVKLFCAFGSVTGVFGNAGQTDYGLANDLLASAVREIGAMYPQLHAQTIEWTAWGGTGMVSDEEVKRFEQAGLTPLTVDSGVELFMEGLLGSAHRRLGVFNAGADFVLARPLEEHLAAARPRARLVEPATGGTARKVHLSLSRDPYLKQHLVNEEPVVPGTFITEIFAEVAREKGLAVADVTFRRPLQLRGRELEIEVVNQSSTLLALPADRPKLSGKALGNLSYSTCRLIEPRDSAGAKLEFTEDHREALEDAGAVSGESFYALLDQNFANVLKTGPVFRGIEATIEAGDLFLGAVSITDDAAALLEIPGDFVFNPVLGDMAVQVVAVHAMQKHRVMAIPAEVGSLYVGGPTRGRRAIVVCKIKESTPELTAVDLAVREPEGRLIFAMDGLVLRAIARAGM